MAVGSSASHDFVSCETVDTSCDVVALFEVHAAPFDHYETVPGRSMKLPKLRGIQFGIIHLQSPAKKQMLQGLSVIVAKVSLEARSGLCDKQKRSR